MANSYVDDIKVKISEKYKPPCKISMPMSYSQRLTLNKQLQDNRQSYDFQLERNVLEKMKELKNIRKNLVEDRIERLELARIEFNERIQQEKLDKLEQEQAQAKLLEEKARIDSDNEQQTNNSYLSTVNADESQQNYISQNSNSNQSQQQSYVTKNGILMPIPVSGYSTNISNILNPMPSSNTNFQAQKSNIKPFNLSDFESDTSSPFDNMELKSINDLEELAQVLKSDRNPVQPNMYQNTNIFQVPTNYSNIMKSYSQLPSTTKSYSNFSQDLTQTRGFEQNPNSRGYSNNPVASQGSHNYNQISSTYSQHNSNYTPISTTYSQFNPSYNLTNNMSYDSSAIPNYSNMNGYYYNTPQMTSQIQLGSQNSTYAPYVSNAVQPSMQKSSCKSVPDLVKSVERELENTHLNDIPQFSSSVEDKFQRPHYTTTNVPIPTRPKSTDAVYPKTKVKDVTYNLFDKLSEEQKEICRYVSGMGFPLDRVARVCLNFGTNQKKIVDHLLALTDLLDLGFSEKDASEALRNNDNDRDKALDVLIS